MKYKFKVGDKVKAHYERGNGGFEYTKEHPFIGVIDSVGTHHNANSYNPYHLEGFYGCWGEDELELIKPTYSFSDALTDSIRGGIAGVLLKHNALEAELLEELTDLKVSIIKSSLNET